MGALTSHASNGCFPAIPGKRLASGFREVSQQGFRAVS
jgi:hypothetical protein